MPEDLFGLLDKEALNALDRAEAVGWLEYLDSTEPSRPAKGARPPSGAFPRFIEPLEDRLVVGTGDARRAFEADLARESPAEDWLRACDNTDGDPKGIGRGLDGLAISNKMYFFMLRIYAGQDRSNATCHYLKQRQAITAA